MKQVLVTGGTGVTGNALIRYLLGQGIRVTAIIRPGSKRGHLLPGHPLLTRVGCSLGNYRTLYSKLKKGEYQAFFHLAWDGSQGEKKTDGRNHMPMQLENIRFLVEAVELCHAIECPVFLATGSQAEYGRYEGAADEETCCNPENGYGIAKQCARQMSEILCRQYGICHIWARLFSVYGPRDGTHSMIDSTVLKLLGGSSPEYTEGIQIWNYLYSMDAAKALYLLAKKQTTGIYCVAHPESRPLKEYIKELHQTVAPGIAPLFGRIPYKDHQVMQMQANIQKLVDLTGFYPEYSFQSGIKEIQDWYQQTGGACGNGKLL